MPSIFIWKATTPAPSSSIIQYTGTNWCLEDHVSHSSSYQYEDQMMLPNGTLVYHVTKMPQNWVGSTLLEVSRMPYQRIREDHHGILEHVGEWMRYQTKQEIPFESDRLEAEWAKIQSPSCTMNKNVEEPCLIRFHAIS